MPYRWTTETPKVGGFYWVKFVDGDIHHQGPMVLDVSIDDAGLCVCEPGGDYGRSIGRYEGQEGVKFLAWSDRPIIPPED
jgi:hypothetical protein